MQQLVDRFKESFVPIDETGLHMMWQPEDSSEYDAADREERQQREAHKLAMAAQDASQNPAQLVKLRQHFQKVPIYVASACKIVDCSTQMNHLHTATLGWASSLHKTADHAARPLTQARVL